MECRDAQTLQPGLRLRGTEVKDDQPTDRDGCAGALGKARG